MTARTTIKIAGNPQLDTPISLGEKNILKAFVIFGEEPLMEGIDFRVNRRKGTITFLSSGRVPVLSQESSTDPEVQIEFTRNRVVASP